MPIRYSRCPCSAPPGHGRPRPRARRVPTIPTVTRPVPSPRPVTPTCSRSRSATARAIRPARPARCRRCPWCPASPTTARSASRTRSPTPTPSRGLPGARRHAVRPPVPDVRRCPESSGLSLTWLRPSESWDAGDRELLCIVADPVGGAVARSRAPPAERRRGAAAAFRSAWPASPRGRPCSRPATGRGRCRDPGAGSAPRRPPYRSGRAGQRPPVERAWAARRADDVSSTSSASAKAPPSARRPHPPRPAARAPGHGCRPGDGQQRWGHQPVAQHDEHVGARALAQVPPVLAMMASLAADLAGLGEHHDGLGVGRGLDPGDRRPLVAGPGHGHRRGLGGPRGQRARRRRRGRCTAARSQAERGDPGGQRGAQAGRVGAAASTTSSTTRHAMLGGRFRPTPAPTGPAVRGAAHAERAATDDLERLEHPVAHGQPAVEHRHAASPARPSAHPSTPRPRPPGHPPPWRPGVDSPRRPAAARRAGEASVCGSPESGDGFTGLGSVGRSCAPTGTPPATASGAGLELGPRPTRPRESSPR